MGARGIARSTANWCHVHAQHSEKLRLFVPITAQRLICLICCHNCHCRYCFHYCNYCYDCDVYPNPCDTTGSRETLAPANLSTAIASAATTANAKVHCALSLRVLLFALPIAAAKCPVPHPRGDGQQWINSKLCLRAGCNATKAAEHGNAMAMTTTLTMTTSNDGD